MATRIVEWKKPYTWWKAIDIDENKVISLRLRDENNLIIYDAWDNEIYVDLQLPDEITPTDAFPVWITTGRVIVDNGWDVQGTIIVAKTTSGDNIKILYADDGKLYMDNGTWSFKQIYFKADVDLIVDSLQAQIDVLSGLGKFLSLWDCATGEPISFPLEIPYEYSTWDWYMINNIDNTTNYRPSWTEYDETASSTVETDWVNIWDVYIYDGTVWLLQKNAWWGWGSVTFAQILWQPTDNTNLATALNAKQDELTAWTNIQIQNNVISATWWSDIVYATQAEYNALLPWALTDNKHYFIYSTNGWGWWQPWTNTLLYLPLDTINTVNDLSGNNYNMTNNGSVSFWIYDWVDCAYFWTTAPYWLKNTSANIINGQYTYLAWINADLSNSWTINPRMFWWSSDWWILWNRFQNTGIYPWYWHNTWVPITSWWHLVSFVGDTTDGSYDSYKDGEYLNSWTWVTGSRNWILIGANEWNNSLSDDRFCGYMSAVIFENRQWSATEISDYFDQTKWDYWIS